MLSTKKRKLCEKVDCKTQPSYNFEEQKKPKFCSAHKEEGMVDVKNKTCEFEDCKTIPTYNFEGQKKPKFCSVHKEEGMVNVKSKTCKNEWCSVIPSNKKYEGYCLFCFVNLFPDKEVCRNYKTKEKCVTSYVQSQFPNFTWVTDKTVEGGCSRRRPDLLLDLGYQVIIVEVDENQHTDYDCSCENRRMMELSQDVDHRPLIFIRFNPDEYTIARKEEEKKVKSCWTVNKQGVCMVSKRKEKEWEERLRILKEQIEYWSAEENNRVDKMVEVVELFYDQKIS